MTLKEKVENFNKLQLKEPIVEINAIDMIRNEPLRPEDDVQCPLSPVLHLCKSAVVMLVHRNIDISKRLINGTIAIVGDFLYNTQHQLTEIKLILISHHSPTIFILNRICWTYVNENQRVTRLQFPLQLA